MQNAKKIVVVYDDLNFALEASELANQLNCSTFFVDDVEQSCFDIILHISLDGLAISLSSLPNLKRFKIDFQSGKIYYRQKISSKKNENIAKAVGIKKNYYPKIIDATAGLGRDAFVLANFGCDVILLEHSPIVAVLLADGLVRAGQNQKIQASIARMKLINMDAKEWLQHQPISDAVIYLDPMFPVRTKSSQVKKEMQILQNLVGHDDLGDALFELALMKTNNRVVVKRPIQAAPLNYQKPNYTIKGKSCRFDVYMR